MSNEITKTETNAISDDIDKVGKHYLTAEELRRAYNLRYKNGLSYGEIGKQLDRHKSTIYDALKRFEAAIGNPAETEQFKEHEASLIDGVRWKILCNLADEERLKKASVNNLGYAYSQLFSAQRLERGESTANVAYHDIDGSLAELRAKREAIEAEIGGVE